MSDAWAICDRCGFKVRHRQLRHEWTGLLVCSPCWDPRPRETTPPCLRPEGLPVCDARPEPPPVFAEETSLPIITSANPSGTYREGVALGGMLTATGTVTWSVSGADAGAVTLNSATGAWSLEEIDYAVQDAYAWTFIATDPAGATTSQVVAIAISPILTADMTTITADSTVYTADAGA